MQSGAAGADGSDEEVYAAAAAALESDAVGVGGGKLENSSGRWILQGAKDCDPNRHVQVLPWTLCDMKIDSLPGVWIIVPKYLHGQPSYLCPHRCLLQASSRLWALWRPWTTPT